MKTGLKISIAFSLGTVTGFLTAKHLLQKYYAEIAQEKIDSARELFKRQQGYDEAIVKYADAEATRAVYERKAAAEAKQKPDISECASRIRKKGYTDYTAYSKSSTPDSPETAEPEESPESDPTESEGDPYTISIEDFDDEEYEGYAKETLTFYADEVLADDSGDAVSDLDATIGGKQALDAFTCPDVDSIYIRNPQRRCDYEIVRDNSRYEDVQ